MIETVLRRTLSRALLSVCFALPAWAQDHHQRRFDDAERWSRVFDDPAREAWQMPAQIIAALALDRGATVADIGAGTGYFAVRLARAVPGGRVYAVDVEPNMVKHLAARAAKEGLPNITAVLAAGDTPRLPAQVDLILMVDTYHHIARRAEYFARLKGALKPGGRVAIIDFTLDSPQGPPVRHRIPPEAVKREMLGTGYALASEHAFLPYQYFLVFKP